MRHRPGGMDLRSERPGITGAMGPSTSWDPWPPPGRASDRGYAGVYTDRRKQALDATTARMQNAPFDEAHTQSAPFRDVARPECALWSRRGGVAGAGHAFP